MQLFVRLKIPRGLGVVLILLMLCGVVTGIGFATAPLVSEQIAQIRDQLPHAVDVVQQWFTHAAHTGALGKLTGTANGNGAQSLQQNVSRAIAGIGSKLLPAAFGLGEGLITVVFLLAMAAFLVHAPETYRRGARGLVPERFKRSFDEGLDRAGGGLRRWIGGIVVSMTIMGALTALGLGLAGIQGWYTLALLTFFGTFIPYLGALASAIPGLAMGLAQGPEKFLAALAVYFCVHVIEGYIVEPFVMQRSVRLPPALLLFWQALMGAVFGILGIIVATPLLVVVLCSRSK